MLDYWVERAPMPAVEGLLGFQNYLVYSGDRHRFAETGSRRDAALIRQAFSLLEGMIDRFPGLADGETDVNGGDLVDFFNEGFQQTKTLHAYLSGDGGYQDDEELYDPELEEATIRGEDKTGGTVGQGANGDGARDALRSGDDAEVPSAPAPRQDDDDGC